MYTITELSSNQFELRKGGNVIGVFPTREDAEKAQNTGTWVDDGKGIDYPVGTDNVHSGHDIRAIPSVPATPHTIQAAPASSSSIIGQTIVSVSTFQQGSVFGVDLFCADNNHYYLKTKQGVLEIGGTHEWDTGVKK